MPSAYTTRNRAEKQAAGENGNTWGVRLNDNTIDKFDDALDGIVSFTISAPKTLTTANGSDDEATKRILDITGGAGDEITIPNVEKWYIVINGASGASTITTGSGTTASVAAGFDAIFVRTASNVVKKLNLYELDADLTAIAALASAANKIPYATGAQAWALADFTAVARTLVGQTTAQAMRETGLGLARGVGFHCPGVPESSEVIAGWIAPYAFAITQANCVVKAQVAATAQTTLTLKKNGSSIGTAVFAISGTTASVTITGTPVSVAANDVLTLHNQASADATLADITGMFKE